MTRTPRPRRCTASSRCSAESWQHSTAPSISRSGPTTCAARSAAASAKCGGIALITLAVTMGCALATWSVQDPSFSHATDAPVRNLLGAPGAIGSDLLMQLFGLASTVLVLPVAVWGWRIATHRDVRPRVAAPAALARRNVARRRALPPACRKARRGRCRPVSAASSATRCCACRASSSVPLSGVHLAAVAVLLGAASLFAIFDRRRLWLAQHRASEARRALGAQGGGPDR